MKNFDTGSVIAVVSLLMGLGLIFGILLSPIKENQARLEKMIKENQAAIKENQAAIKENQTAIKENQVELKEIKTELKEIKNLIRLSKQAGS